MQPIHIIKIILALGFISFTQQQPFDLHTTMQHVVRASKWFLIIIAHMQPPVLKLPQY
jgi:hypothetical protein